MKAIFLCAAGLIFGLLLAAAASAQQYKWVDPDGRVRYGDQPPPGVKATPLRPTPAGPAAAPAAAGKGAKPSPEAAFRQRQVDAQKQDEAEAKAKEEAATRKAYCAQAQEGLRILESGDRIQRTDEKGERFYVDDERRAVETEKARKAVAGWCG